ncbi:hypothetical protein ILYODFUR_036423, partial [Ilyodon furcidens]
IFPTLDHQLTTSLKPAAHNSGGSLPDLTNIQFPPPLPTPLDSDDPAASSFGPPSSTQTLGTTQGVNTSQSTVTMEMQSGQNNMVPVILNPGDSHQQQNMQLSQTSPQLPLSQVPPVLHESFNIRTLRIICWILFGALVLDSSALGLCAGAWLPERLGCWPLRCGSMIG